jgi:hypothetical protein
MVDGLTGRSRWYLGLVLGLIVGALTFTAFASASAKRPLDATTTKATSLKQTTNCLRLFPTSEIASITGIGAKVYYHTFYKSTEGDPAFDYSSTGRIAGWACSWLAVNPPWGDPNLLQNTAFVSAGYGETEKSWKKFEAYYRGGAVFESLGGTTWGGTVKLGHSSQAFLVTENLWGYEGLTSSDGVPDFPEYLYVVTAMSRHHNVLQIAFDNASLVQTEADAKRVLAGSF